MTNLNDLEETSPRGADVPFGPIFQRPDEVLGDPEMTREEKRALLASWASDAHAVPGLPSMRRLEGGSLIDVDEILQALKALDAASDPGPLTTPLWRTPPQRRSRPSLRNWARIMRRRRRDDDAIRRLLLCWQPFRRNPVVAAHLRIQNRRWLDRRRSSRTRLAIGERRRVR